MDVVILIGRILMSAIFVGSGIGHLTDTDGTAAYAEARGVPNPRLMAQLSGVLIGIAGVSVLLGIWPDLGALGMAAYAFIAAFWVHHFWTDEDPMTQQAEMSGFMKNLSIAGGALVLFGFLQMNDGVGLTITENLFNF